MGRGGPVARLEQGDGAAFSLLYDRHQPAVFRYALRMSGSRETADDVVQEVFLGLIRGARGFDAQVGPLRSYLYGMARRLLVRQSPPREESDLEGVEVAIAADPLAGMEQAEALERLKQALLAIPAHYREVVVLCDLEELDYAHAAEVLGCAVGTVRSAAAPGSRHAGGTIDASEGEGVKATNLESALRALAEETSRAEASPEVRGNLLAALSAQRKARRPAWQLWGFRLWSVAAAACLIAGFWLGSGRRDSVSGRPGLAELAVVEPKAGASPATEFSVPDSQRQPEAEPVDAGGRTAPAAVSLPARGSTIEAAAVTPWYFHSGLRPPRQVA